MRKLAPLVMLLTLACHPPAAPAPAAAPEPPKATGPYGMTVTEEARVLAMEDRREFDAATVAQWVAHENSLHRQRIALALGRIGPHVRQGVPELIRLSTDPERSVRETAAFSLGEIGEPSSIEALFTMTGDADAAVAGEAIEALSKLGGTDAFKPHVARYVALTNGALPEGLRARAIRFLFRLNDDGQNAAIAALASPSSAIRQEGAYSLSRRATPAARAQLELLLSDPNVLTRTYAAGALGRIGESASVAPLVLTLGDVHPWVRTNAAVALGRIFDKDKSGIRSDDLPRIFAAMEDPDPGVRASMMDALAYYAENNATARTRLLGIVQNSTKWERELAAGAIAKHFAPESGVYAQIGTPQPWQAVRMLEGSAGKPYGTTLRAQFASHADPIVRAAAISNIPDDAVDPELALVRNALRDADVIVRAVALDKYGKAKSENADTWLATLREAEQRERTSQMNDARLSAIGALADRESADRAAFLRALLSDADPVVRRVAADAIADKLHEARPTFTPLPNNRSAADYEQIVQWSRQQHTATIHMTRGKIELALLTMDAPLTAWNFAQLAQKRFFDNTSFMRVVPNFVIQGGDPRNDMNGGPGYAIRDEINLQKYTRGAVGMALSGPDTGGSQFFITHSPQPHLDGGYTIFARVYDGMTSVVDQTERGDRVETITIDEHPPVSAQEVTSVANVSLPLFIGPVTADRLLSAVPSYQQRRSDYTPDLTVIEMLKSYVRAGDHMEVFMGTWCSDSEREVPKFLRVTDDLKSQFGVDLPVKFIAVDRAKQQPADLLKGKSVHKVATFIYYRGDEELGRIEERPRGAQFEDDLLTIVAQK